MFCFLAGRPLRWIYSMRSNGSWNDCNYWKTFRLTDPTGGEIIAFPARQGGAVGGKIHEMDIPMADLLMNFSRGITASVFALTLFALPVAAIAAVDIDPGTTASDLVADGGNIIEECEDTATETCTVVINDAGNEVGALVDVTEDGSGIASGEVYTDFNITGVQEGALVGSFLSAEVDVFGILSGLGPNAVASVKVSLEVTDTTEDVLVAAETVVDDSIADGTIPVSGKNALAMSLPLTRGHSYRVSLIIRALATGSPGDVAGALSDFANTASWSGLSVTAGDDPFALISKLDIRVTQLETDVDALETDVDALEERVDGIEGDIEELDEEVDQLREDFDNHSHTYLTGKGTGHNNTEADSGTPVLPVSEPDDESGDVEDGDGVEGADDRCPGTPEGAEVDASGCELAAFCALQERITVCTKADWRDDESRNPRDCRWRRGACEAR
jgi:hypothetical protein